MAERPLYTLYKNLKAQNYDVPDDYNKFESALTRDGKGGADNRHAIYENLKAQNFDVPSTYERFYSALFEPRSKTSSRAKGGSVPMSAADRARFLAGAQSVLNTARQVKRASGNIRKTVERAKKFNANDGKVTIGFKNPLQNQNVQKNEFNYNATTGKTGTYTTTDGVEFDNEYDAAQYQNKLDKQGQQYINAVNAGEIPSVFDVRGKNGNYDLQENIGKNGTYLTEEGAQKQFDKKLADAYARKKEIEALIAEDNRKHGNPLLSYGASIGASNGRTAEQSDYRNKLATSLSLVTEQIGALEAVKQYPTSSWGEDALKALDNTAFTAKTWDFGLTDFATMGQMERIKTKMDNKIPLSGSDKMLLKSKLGADAAAALEDEKMGNIYRWTKIAGQSLPFMADFFLTGGYGGITKGISRGALKFAAKRGMGKVSAAILKNTGIVAGDVIGSYAMAGTEQALKTGADIMQRHLGNLYQDEKGDYKFGTFDENGNLLHEGGESMGTALYKGMTSAMVENYTEKLFGHNYGIKKGAVNFMEKHGMNASAEFFKNIGKSGWYTNSKKWMEKFGINGFAEEVMEEEIGIPLHALLDGEGKVSDLLDAKQQLDIIGGMAISVGSMYAMGAGSRPVKGIYNRAQYYRFRNKVNVADSDAQNLMGDNWADIKDKIDNATNEQMGSVLAGILRQRDTMSKEQINAAVNYGVNLMKMRGYNIAKTAEMNAKEITNEPTTPEEQHQADIDNAYSEGHDADDADKHDIQIQQEDQMKTLAAALGISEQQLSAMSDEELESLTGQDDKLDQAIYDYQLSSARYQGVVDDAQDKVDLAAHQAEQRVDMYTDQSRGSVRNATIKASGGLEDYGVYIISGNIATHDDGSIDVSNSDDMILYYDPTTNSVEHADALMFAELGEELPADEVKVQAVADAKENAIKEVAGIIDGTVEVGSQFNVTDTDGTEHTYEVLADYGDGTAAISIDGNVVENPYSLADLQQMKDLEDQKRLEAAKAEREQMEKERAAQQNQEAEETQPSFDFNQILNDNGNVVLVDVLDKDGNTKYPDSRLFLIRDAGAKAKVVELKSDGTLVPHAVNKEDVATISSMSLDEYKQAMPESSMIEDNSGEESDEDSQLANLGLPKGSEIWMSGDGFGRPKENTLSKVVGIDEQGSIILEDKDGKKWSASFDYINNHRELPPLDENTNIVNEENNQSESNSEENTPAPEQTPAMTLEDGTIVPMLEDGNPDFSKLTAAQTAELYDTQFGEDADSIVSGYVSDAKKALDKASNMTVKGKTFVEQKAAKDAKEKAIADAQAAYDSAIAIRDAYNERQLAKVEDTAEGRKELIEKARRKFARLKSAVKDDAEAVSQLYRDTIGSLLHRLYDSTGIDVTDTTPLTAEEYVASNLGAHSLNYEGTETSKGVKQETGLSREDFAKTQLLAADGKGTTIDALVHSLWENRPSNLESLDTQDIRNALIGVLNSGFKASEARNFVENIRIAQAENILEEQKRAQENAAYAEQHKAEPEAELKAKSDEKAELKAKSEAKFDNESDNKSNDLSNKSDNEKINDNINDNINTLTPEQQKAKEDGEKLGLPAVDKEGEPINEYVVELAEWAKEQGLEIDPTSKLNSYADLFLMCKDGFGVSTLVPDEGENINQVVYFPDNVQDFDQLLKLQEEFNAGRDPKHSSNIDSEITEGATFYDADTAREFKEFVDKKVEEQDKVFGEQKSEEDLPFSAKENGKQQTTAERAADVEKNKVDDMKVVDNIVGEKTRKAFERLAKMMGANIQWQYSDKLGNGWIQETKDADGNVHRTIFITLDSSIKEGAQFIFGHEMTHQIKNLNPAAYNELTQLVLETYGSDAFDKAVDETMQRYSDAGFSGRARDYYAEEVVADAVGEMIRDLNLAHTLAMKMSHPLLAAIHEILQKIKLAFFGTEYSDVTKNIIRSIEQAYVKTANGQVTNSETGEDVSFSLRQKPEPKKKGIGYKVFVLKDGKLYPPMVANPDGAATPVGVWLDADAAPIAGESKTGRPQVKQGGKGTQGGSGKLAYRPGWHLGVVPYAIQFNRKDAEGNKTLFPKNFVFAEVEYAADVDYQDEARQEGINPSGKYQHSLAGLKHLPTDGYYMYRTNPNPETDPWVITGAMKVNRILTRAEQAELVKNAGREPQQIQEGDIVTDDVVNSINQEIADAPKFSLKSKPVRFEAGKKLSDEEKKEVLSTLKDAYKVNGVPYHIEETAGGKEKRVYEPIADSYVVSDITNRPLRYYITLPDGRVAHPTEVYPNISDNEVKSSATKQGLLDDEADQIISAAIDNMKDISNNAKAVEVLTELQNLQHETHDVGYGLNNAQSYNYKTGIFTSDAAQAIDYVVRRMRRKEDVPADVVNAVKTAVKDSYGMVDNLIDGLVDSVNPSGVGAFGNIYNQFKGKAKEAINFLKKLGGGEATAALHHHAIGDISLVWGDKKTGLAKILRKHPEVVDNLQSIIDSMEVVSETDNRIKLESPTHFAVVSKEFKGEPREKWLLTAYEKKESLANDKSMDTATTSLGGDTALSQTKESAAKIDNSSETAKENEEKVDVEEPKTFEEFLNHPSLKFSIKNEEQRKAAEDAYEYASKLRPNKYAQYALVDMSNPSNSPEYYEKKVLADRWRRFYNKAVHNELDDVYKDAWGNYKLFDLDQPFADQVNEVKGDVPSEFNAPDVEANKNADNESGAEYHEYKQDEPSSVTYKDRYKAFKQREANREKTAGLRKELKEVEDSYNSKSEQRIEYNKQLMKVYMDKHGLSSENDIPEDIWNDLRDKSFEKYQDELDSLFNKYKDLDRQIKAVAEPRFSLKDEKTLVGVHNITEEKLRKALKLGGFANPSLAVIDTSKSGHDNFGEISFIAPSALLDKRTGNTGGTWITDAYTQRYPSIEREMSEKGSQKFKDWVDSLEYPSEAKAEIKRQAEDALSNNNAPAWELMYLKEKGIDIKEYDSRIDYRWKEIISDHPTAEDILNSMQTDPELNEKVTGLAKHAIIHPTWEKISLEVRRQMYKETGVKASPINPQVRKQTKEIFERDYKSTLLNKDGSPRKKDVKKVVEDIVKEHNDTKQYDFYLSKVKASNYVNKNGLYDDYIKWQENKLDEFGTKNRIFRGYKNDGSRKYVPETLENVSKAMREDANGQTNGSEYTSFGSFIAKLASRVDSTDEMRANKDKLSSNEDKEAFYEKWSNVYYDLAKSLYDDVFYGEQRLHDIVSQADPKKYAKKEYGITLTPTFMKKLDALKKAVQIELKSAYFETKYNRPLRLNEFAAAVVPNNLGDDVRKGISDAGLPMYDYDPKKDGDRSRAFNEAINSSDNIRFSLKDEKEKIVADAKANGTYMIAPNGEKTKLDAEQWATVRTTNFKNWFGDWENDPENASKVVDENGEPLVAYHGTTNDETTSVWNEKTKMYDTSHEPFTVFKREVDGLPNSGLFFNSSEDNAYEYGYNNYAVYLSAKNPLVIDCKGSLYNSIKHDGKTMDTYDWANWAEENGYDGVIFKNIKDGVDYGSMQDTTDDYVVFKSNQIKSAENNNGDFSADNNDIRFSLKSMMAKPEGWKQANKKAIHIAEAIERDPKFSLKNLDGTLIKAGTYFSGGGLVEEGLKGIIDPVVAVEYDEKISGVYRNNFGQHIVTADVRDVDPKDLVKQIDGEVEYFHASPVCKNYSQAKSNHAEVELDKETAASTAEFINAVKPKVVTIENVKGYKDSDAMKTITDALDANGYTWDADVYNAADYGGYTNRERLIVRAVRDGKLPEKPKKMAHKSGWYEAVADIIPTLTEKKNGVAPWMDIRLKADGIDWRHIDKPLYVMGSAYADGKIPHAFADELLPTLRTKSGDVIVMPDGKVYRAMGRVLARVSGVSDDYKMPFSENLSHTIIGNGIPTQLTEHVIAPLLQNTLRPTTPEDGNTKFSLRYDQFEHDLNQWKKDNNLPKDAQRPTIPQRNAGESAVDFLRRVDEYRKQMALWKTAPTYEQHLLSDDTALGEFNRELQRGSVLKRIAFQDSMLAIRKAQEAIMKEVGVDRLNMAEDAYTAENRSHGKGKNEFEEYNNEFLQPLRKAYHQMKKILGDSYDNVRIYMMAKHGLERDAQMAFKKSLEADYEDVAQRSAAYKAYKGDMNRIINDSDLEFGRVDFTNWRQRDNALRVKYSPSYMNYRYDKNGIAYDYSGLSALFDGSDFEEAAHKLVKDIESKYVAETHDLWDATNAATKKILRDGYKAGMMSKDTYQYVRDMYSHYIPLRGWDGTTADQVWDYIGGGKGAFNQTLKTAHGRTSIADDPIAYIENMAESGILLNNKNWVKQHLMLLAQNHPTSLLTLSKAWYVKSVDDNGNEEWIPATPQITSQMDSNQVKAAIDAFEKKMEKMAQTGDATQKRDGLNIAYPQTHSEEREHEVRVMKDGEEYVIYVNGDPQLAQAMNNTRAHRVREIQSGKLDRAAAWLGRKMAAAYTSLSPLFIPSNYFRDLTMTLASTAIREDAKYNYLLRKNLATSWNLGFMLRDYQNGKLREKVSNGNATPKEQMFYDFMMNGGETGFVSSLDVEDLKKKFKNDLKDLDRWKTNPVKVGHTIMDSIEFLNRAIEDSNRFAVYMTSIQYGRSIDEAVNDAKDVTLNFNRKGTGEYGWQMIRNLYLFINPAVQSLQTLGALVKHHPFKFTAVTASWLASGVLVPIVNAALMSMLGGDDDKDKYWQFTKWDRRNNLIMWVPYTHEYVKIPLAQEFRAFYGIGDMIASKMMGGELAEESWSQYAEDLLGQVVDMLPLDPTGYDGNIAVSLMPNAIRPVFELAFNVDFTGKPLFKETEYNKYDPNFTKAYVGTPDWLVRASKMVNSIGNDYPDVQQNSIDAFGDPKYNLNNPAVVDHVLSSYLGGAYTMGSQVLGVLTKSLNDPKEIKVADIPLFSKFVSNPDDRPVTKKQGDEFWDMKENHDRAANTLSKLKKQAKVDGDYSMLERFYGSDEYKQYKQDDVKVKKYEEDKKKERAEESGEEYRPHKLNAEDIYKAHATPKDDFEDLKLKQLYTKLNGFKTSYGLLVDTAPSQSEGYYNTNKAAIDAIDEIFIDKQEISELKKGFLDDGKDAYNAEDMKQIRELRKKILAVLEKANKVVVANQKAKAEK